MIDTVVKATCNDLEEILSWLEREYIENDNEGFWCNRSIIGDSYDKDSLWVVRRNGVAVAFHAGWSIFCVRQDLHRQGLGSLLVEAALERAYRDGVNVVHGQSMPRTSFPFWQKHGFESYGNVDPLVPIPIRRRIERPTRKVDVMVSFYPEIVDENNIAPIVAYDLIGFRMDDGYIMLERRVIGLSEDAGQWNSGSQRDLVVRVVVGTKELCFCKAKYEEAANVGIMYDGDCFYVDEIFVDEEQ